MDHTPTRTPEREAFYNTIDKSSLTPLWEVLAKLVTKEPVTPASRICGTTTRCGPT